MDKSTAPAGTGTGGAPVLVNSQQARGGGGGGGSHGHADSDVGPVLGVLAVIGVLGIIAGLIGRLCSGRTIMGYGPHIDVEAWLESKFSSCLEGHVPTAVNANPRFPHPHLITTFPTPTGAATATAAFRPPNLHRPQQVHITATSSHCDSDSFSNSDISVDEVVQPHKHQQKLRPQRQAQNHDESSSSSDHHQELNNHHHYHQQRPHHPH